MYSEFSYSLVSRFSLLLYIITLIFLDGLVNQGVKDQATIFKNVCEIREKGVSVSAFGIGSDFDEELMKSISEYLTVSGFILIYFSLI